MMEIADPERISSALAAFVVGAPKARLSPCYVSSLPQQGSNGMSSKARSRRKSRSYTCVHVRMLRIRNQLLVFAATYPTVSPKAPAALGWR